MTALDDALARVKAVKFNALNLADPDVAAADAELAFKEAVVTALNQLIDPTAPATKVPPVDSAHVEQGAEQFSAAAIESAAQAAAAAFVGAIHYPTAEVQGASNNAAAPAQDVPAQTAGDVAPPTIAPSNTGV